MIAQRGQRGRFDDIYRAARADVASGQYRPGDRIEIDGLADRLATSATPVREALSRLVGEGLVIEHRGRGYFMAPLGQKDIADFYRARGQILDLALRGIKGNGQARTVIDTNRIDVEPSTRPPANSFAAIIEVSGNAALDALWRSLAARLLPVGPWEARLIAASDWDRETFQAALTGWVFADLRRLVTDYHRRCARAAGDAAQAMHRRPPII